MPKPGEFTYFQRIGETGRKHSLNKPFSDDETASMLMDVGMIFSMLPPPPAKILECGCGAGWLSYFLAQKGYTVVGQDCAGDAIDLARNNPIFTKKYGDISFVCSDFESLNYRDEFDAILFYSSLHHSEDEKKAIDCAYTALRENGLFIAIEPGVGHEKASKSVIETYDVGDRDMPPKLVAKRGREIGFRKIRVYHPTRHLLITFYDKAITRNRVASLIFSIPGMKVFKFLLYSVIGKRNDGIICMRK